MFLTFCDGFNPKYSIAVKSLIQMVKDYQLFDRLFVEHIPSLEHYPPFKKHMPFVNKNKHRGYGYWIWKPYAIRKTMEESLEEGDILLYLDACTSLNLEGKPRFLEYIEKVKQSPYGNLVLGSPHRVQKWCKMDLIQAMNAHGLIEKEMLMAGIILLTKNAQTMDMLNKWCDWLGNYHLLDDSPSVSPNHPEFYEHRHDQSVFTLLFHTHPVFTDTHVICDKEYYFPDKNPSDRVYPIWIQSNYY